MTTADRARPETDGGFTLIELVISVAISGIVVAALTGVVLSYLRTTVDTQARLTESHDVQFAAAYWQRDVASVGVRSTTYDTASHSFPLQQSVGLPACALPAGATAVVTLAWSEYTSAVSTAAPTTVRVTYATRAEAGSYELLRVRCGSQESTIQLADSLVAQPEATCVQSGGGSVCTGTGDQVPRSVELRLRAQDSSAHDPRPYAATLSGERRQS